MKTRGKSPKRIDKGRKASENAENPPSWAIRDMITLGRPRFLVYSLVCHLLGASLAGRPPNWTIFFWLQVAVWSTHLTAHYVNEWADLEADAANANTGGWTGGSQVLVKGLLPRWMALVLGAGFACVACLGGTKAVQEYVWVHHGILVVWSTGQGVIQGFLASPWDLVALGVSVLAVAVAYSLPPFRLSANALGECCVAYVLSFCCPVMGLLAQGVSLDMPRFNVLLPFIIVSFARMIVMNIADREGDAAVGKRTSVVWLGEERAVLLVDTLHLATYVCVIPQLASLPTLVRIAHYAPLPLRWWQSIRLNSPHWWNDKDLVLSIPFVESMIVLSHATALTIALFLSQAEH